MLLNAKPLTCAYSIFMIIRLPKFSVLSELFHYLCKVSLQRRVMESSKQLQMWMEFGISDVLKKMGRGCKTTTKQTKQETQSQ